MRKDEETIRKSLEGNWRAEHILALKQRLSLYRSHCDLINECDKEMEKLIAAFDPGWIQVNRVGNALRLAVNSLFRSESYLRAKFRKLRARRGAPKAMARYLGCLVYRILTHARHGLIVGPGTSNKRTDNGR